MIGNQDYQFISRETVTPSLSIALLTTKRPSQFTLKPFVLLTCNIYIYMSAVTPESVISWAFVAVLLFEPPAVYPYVAIGVPLREEVILLISCT